MTFELRSPARLLQDAHIVEDRMNLHNLAIPSAPPAADGMMRCWIRVSAPQNRRICTTIAANFANIRLHLHEIGDSFPRLLKLWPCFVFCYFDTLYFGHLNIRIFEFLILRNVDFYFDTLLVFYSLYFHF